MILAEGEITAAGNFPDANGVKINRDSVLTILGGTNLAGNVQVKGINGSFTTHPGISAFANNTNVFEEIPGADGLLVRINVTGTPTGSWRYQISTKNK